MPLTTSPRGGVSPIGFLYWMALNVAAERVDIATPYFLPDVSVTRAIRDASVRGLDIRLLLPDDHNDSRLLRWASIGHYPMLLDGGIEIWEFEASMMHTKAVIVDDRWAIIGSANFDNRSFELNDEITLAVEDPSLVTDIEASFRHDLERSRRIEEADIRNRSLRARSRSRLSLMLREQL